MTVHESKPRFDPGGLVNSLREQAQDNAERMLDQAGEAIESVGSAVSEFKQNVSSAATTTSEALDDAWDELRGTLPTFAEIVGQASRMPGVRVDRVSYLTTVLGPKCDPIRLRIALERTPARAGISPKQLDKLARRSIAKESHRTTLISAAAGIPGGAAMAATVPADLVQFWMHLLRTLQKLSYLYGWRDLVYLDGKEIDESKRAALVLFLAMMAGVEQADDALHSLAVLRVAGATERDLEEALRHEPYASAVKVSSAELSQRTATRMTGQVAGKAVPLVGAIISGRISNAGFNDMAKRLHKQLRSYGG